MPATGACSSCDRAQYSRQIAAASSPRRRLMMVVQGVADPLQLLQGGGQRALLHAALCSSHRVTG
ncbi:hypothetical protein LN650_14440 [Klebsiella pneumoniae subsp. pneumoniae]|nr:hypothetical protein [Klebsiella pneumoniae subsp. pneumoniae]